MVLGIWTNRILENRVMAKKRIEHYAPTLKELAAMYFCTKNNVAYIQEANKNGKYNIVKYNPNDYKNVIYLKESNKKVEFNLEDVQRKVMNLYIEQEKRFRNER